RRLKPEDLPPLNQVQREAAKKMKVSEEEYARSFVAAEQSKAALLAKTERLARFISDQISRIAPNAKVQRILLSVDHGFEVELMIEGASTPVRIREELVDDFFEGGSVEAEKGIIRILNTAAKYHNRVVQ